MMLLNYEKVLLFTLGTFSLVLHLDYATKK